ncbi:MAG: TraR/DksA C4-type zinc finger protein [Proteobacteria bacterium]|nr:TraR/DksA C4-type zinc finger protein [Pseudomonadota bacterium]
MSDDVDRAQEREAQLRQDALARQGRRAARFAGLPAAEFCGEHLTGAAGCGEVIPEARRAAVQGCQLCRDCQALDEQLHRGV